MVGEGTVRGGHARAALTGINSTVLICFPMLRYVVRERVIRIRCAQQRLPEGKKR